MIQLFCNKRDCVNVVNNSIPLYFDGDHYTREGAVHAARSILDILNAQ